MADDPLDSLPTDWARPPITLVPVDHDPFNDAWAHVPFNDSAAGGGPFDGPPFSTSSFYRPGQSFTLQSESGDSSPVPGKITGAASAAGVRNDGSSINWVTPSISLVPVDHDPFNDSLAREQFNNSWAATETLTSHLGNDILPTLPAQYDFFTRQP